MIKKSYTDNNKRI